MGKRINKKTRKITNDIVNKYGEELGNNIDNIFSKTPNLDWFE